MIDREKVCALIKEVSSQSLEERDILINILHRIQDHFGNYIPPEAAEIVAEELNVPPSKVYEVLTFYTMFSTKPRGRYVIRVCVNLPCHVTGGREIVKTIQEMLNVKFGETTEDGLFTLETTSCLGLCGVAPVIMINDQYYGDLTVKKIREIIESLRQGGEKQ
ncbi:MULTISPECIES: NADH-quinone oxidoreductase subunit NuoE [Pseudothermotoga]|jgi:NADH-quinone oxidoreductase subunit E|uniref:NADH-quinone oxidoreductase, E subunit n=1 Tax=Pseudothermotoga lettingae (strain ATCC BAA-301 / DSM 14385 / NBRC 107922 / TMO) TaxID=416591 RepID=A8F7E1_PSELT|nr:MULTISPECIES: NADH-quinone oxidoreductase subunit NuoE [Pseudothermotoga]ABV34075.1 NADH-quinone oxidoreductase, E subunit [Pseudothermotoga lettingae TMO]KUK20856.1 MAG: NADH-quinone oxidoreductase, E subunit [Pseudothermotoga lettingae]MDI3494680.1 NADH-quinone oxidoreductase subunit [Pseudothermotoga sp.]MDK2884700.1 NADH-quinone oxidoreductase subunit [Pseudothermotoga sp.]GLI48986.1 NADH-quinone oxidoreductase subunit E [Pseudothermotoga lettingae TMO]